MSRFYYKNRIPSVAPITSQWLVGLGFYLYLILAFLIQDNFYAVDRFNRIGLNVQGNYGLGEYLRQAVFIFEYLLAVLIICLSAYSKKIFAIPFLILLWILSVIELSFFQIQSKPISFSDVAILNAAIGNIFDATQQFGSAIGHATLMSMILFLPALTFVFVQRSIKTTPCFSVIGSAILLLLYFATLLSRGEPALIGFPKGYSYGFGSLAIELNSITKIFGDEKSLPITTYPTVLQQKKIIVVIDESVEWQRFQDVFQHPANNVVDYGKAWSGANCSAASNYILRKASWYRDISSSIKPVTSLFELAKASGYKTVYIDNQDVLSDPTVRNYFDQKELASIQEIIHSDKPLYARDNQSLLYLKEILTKPEKVFVVINKVGAHFPYQNSISPEIRSEDTKANYYAALRVQSSDFINELAVSLSPDSIVFYTSDHGQNLNGRASQCSSGESIDESEYSIPFIVLVGNPSIKLELENRKPALFGKLTHLEWSESIRNQLGYQVQNVGSIFKQSELVKSPYCGIYGSPISVFGIAPKCFPLALNSN